MAPTRFLPSTAPIPTLVVRCSLQLPFHKRINCQNAAILSSISFSSDSCRIQTRISSTNGDNDRRGYSKEFSVLPSNAPWDDGDIWSIFGAYLFILHVPLSFGGIAVISKILHQPVLDPLAEAISAVMLQTVEFVGALSLLHYSAKSQFGLSSIFGDENIPNRRSWIRASTTGIGFLFLFALLTSFLADLLIGTKVVNDPILQEIIASSPASKAVCLFIYCFSTPLLEELVYRRFLLRSLASTMSWQKAVLVSAIVFSTSHFSGENAVQLFIIGSVLGSVYCWSGNLVSSIVVHSVYNAAILIVTGSL